VVAPRCFEEEDLAQAVKIELRIEEERPHRLGERRTTGLPGHDRSVAEGPQPLIDKRELGALAGALSSLERDEITA
jgi:hypothetical protein